MANAGPAVWQKRALQYGKCGLCSMANAGSAVWQKRALQYGKSGLKAQKPQAQGNALGRYCRMNAPCKGKSIISSKLKNK